MTSIAFVAPSSDASPRPAVRPRQPSATRHVHRQNSRYGRGSQRLVAVAGALLLHAMAMFLIAAAPFDRSSPPAVMQATLIAPQPMPVVEPEPVKEVERIEPKPAKPVKRPQPRREEAALPQIVAAADAPSPVSAAVPLPVPAEPVAVDAAPAPVAAPSQTSAATIPPPPVSLPRFNADYLQNPAPAYPSLSKRLGEQGRVVLRVMVEANGLPSKVEVRTTSGFPRLDQAALEAVRNWKFVPARRGDETVAAAVNVPIDFRVRD